VNILRWIVSYHVSVLSFVGAVFEDDAAVPGRCGSSSGAETEAYAGCARDGRLATTNRCCLRELETTDTLITEAENGVLAPMSGGRCVSACTVFSWPEMSFVGFLLLVCIVNVIRGTGTATSQEAQSR